MPLRRQSAKKGTYFEELIRTYFRYEATYALTALRRLALRRLGEGGRRAGIRLQRQGHRHRPRRQDPRTEEPHAIQCKCYAAGPPGTKADID